MRSVPKKKIDELLTNEGKKALLSRDMLNVIQDATLQRFRVPGAHIGFLPFSIAEESKKYVEENLPNIETWFI